jgi:tetratricopeptide (TPR) repeat protein
MTDAVPETPDKLWARARKALSSGAHREAVELYECYLATAPAGDERRPAGRECVFHALARLGEWAEIEARARRSLAEDGATAAAERYLGEALIQAGRLDEAHAALERALALNPELTEARNLLAVAARQGREGQDEAPTRWRAWPQKTSRFDDLDGVIRRHVLHGVRRERFIRRETVFMTLGSCFADNLAKALRARGFDVRAEPIGEEVNSTRANRALLEWVANGAVDGATTAMAEAYGEATRARLGERIAAADVIVLTIGVAPIHVDRQTGEFAFMHARSQTAREHFMRANVMRTTTVQENVDNIRRIIEVVRGLSARDPRFVLTVSPVPLGATSEYGSAVIADCVSKSTLRVACEEVIRSSDDRVHYWPSFEMVRWLGPLMQRPAFGEDDGNTRHVSAWLVERIINSFVEWHSADA